MHQIVWNIRYVSHQNATIGTVCEWFANGYWCGDELLSIDFDAIVYWLWYIRAFIKDDVANKHWDHS